MDHLRQVLNDYVEHYKLARPYRSLELRAPLGIDQAGQPNGEIVCHSRLGGLLHEYSRKAT